MKGSVGENLLVDSGEDVPLREEKSPQENGFACILLLAGSAAK